MLVKYCKMSSIILALVVGSQLPPPMDVASIMPWQTEHLYNLCQPMDTNMRSSGMSDCEIQGLPLGLGNIVVVCEKLVAFYNELQNNLHNDSHLLTPLDPLMQVQKPAESQMKTCETQLFPWLSFLNVLLASVMLGHSLYRMFRPMTWYYGYECKRCCSLYLFVYDGDNYTPIKVKTLEGSYALLHD